MRPQRPIGDTLPAEVSADVSGDVAVDVAGDASGERSGAGRAGSAAGARGPRSADSLADDSQVSTRGEARRPRGRAAAPGAVTPGSWVGASNGPGSGFTSGAGRTPGSAGLLAKVDRLQAIQREEHRAAVRRLRASGRIGLVAWPLFGVMDWVVATFIVPGTLGYFWGLRAVGVGLVLVAVTLLRREPPLSPRGLRALDLVVFTALALLISLQSLRFYGIESPLLGGILLVMVGRAATMSEPWRRGIVHYGLMALMFPLVWGTAALLSLEARAWFGDRRSVAIFALYNGFLLGAGGIMLLAGHGMDLLRRRSFEEKNVGRYRLIRRIGSGGMGEVWVAQHQGLKREVALKILRMDLFDASSAGALLRFEREVTVTAELTHPNTIRVMDFGVTEEGVPYYAMELLRGCDLKTLVKREGPLDPRRVVYLVRQACASLAEAHRRGVVHRDVKPENLFVTVLGDQADFVKVLDFGIVKRLREAEEALTVAGGLAGTPHYMAPEAAQGRAADARADVYALGAVMYYALCGRPPFEGPTDWAILSQHVTDEPERPSLYRGEALPEELEAVVMRCLDKDPQARPADAAELLELLEGLDGREGLSPWRPAALGG